jgi:segregation and condensation protein A
MNDLFLNFDEKEVVDKYNVDISNFEGPLDLLVFLVNKNKMDIFSISLSELTDKYIEYINTMQDMNMEIATEFITTASQLLYLKSKKLLPIAEPVEEIDDQISEEELLQRIAQYKLYKDKQQQFIDMYNEGFGTFVKMPETISFKKNLDFSDVLDTTKMYISYSNILQRNMEKVNKKADEIKKIALYERVTVRDKVEKIMSILNENEKFVFNKIFMGKQDEKIDVVTAFLGILELSKLKAASLYQSNIFGDIEVQNLYNTEVDLSLIKE